MKQLIAKFNEKFEVRVSDVEEQMGKFGKFIRKTEDTIARQENMIRKEMEEMKEGVWRRVGDADIKLERKVKEMEGALDRGKGINVKNMTQGKLVLNILRRFYKEKQRIWKGELIRRRRMSNCKWIW
jgi:hypothetical protein